MGCSMNCPENWLRKTNNEIVILYGEHNGLTQLPVYICIECKRYYIKILNAWLEVMINLNDEWEIIGVKA